MHQRLIDQLVRPIAWDPSRGDPEPIVAHEWLVTNGLGGYSSSTVAGVNTRRYHGLLIAALPNPLGRMVMLNQMQERLVLPDGTVASLGGEERTGGRLDVPAASYLAEFRLDGGLPVWRYAVGGAELEKRLVMPHGQNTVYVRYRLLSGDGPLRLELRPTVHFRGYEAPVDTPIHEHYHLTIDGDHYVVTASTELPPLRIAVLGEESALTMRAERSEAFFYRVERRRGYQSEGALWSPGYFSLRLSTGRDAAFVASAEPYEIMRALSPDDAFGAEYERRRRLLATAPPAARSTVAAELVLAADQFIITPTGRHTDGARARAVGDEVRTIIAGYHWFTDWGRDTMISLEGLTLATGRHREASFILRTFAHYVRDGLIPNMFPDGSNEGLYHTADATLWFFHAVHRYVRATGDRSTLALMLPTLRDIVDHHLRGTRFGIGVDERDGLLRQGADGFQLTWMDAKVDDWVVTPRRGKAVEINALWYNALCLLEGWVRERGDETGADRLAEYATRARRSFNDRFWYEEGGYLYDVVDGPNGDGAECRPNQLFAIALDHPVLDRSRWAPVLRVAEERLLTPVGLRSLAPGSANYRATYDGDLRARDAAYHQGTVWGWLIGPWTDAYLKVHPDDRAGARRFLLGLADQLSEYGVGSIAEIFDAEAPYTPRGCIAQAWSVAEELRCWLLTEPDGEPLAG